MYNDLYIGHMNASQLSWFRSSDMVRYFAREWPGRASRNGRAYAWDNASADEESLPITARAPGHVRVFFAALTQRVRGSLLPPPMTSTPPPRNGHAMRSRCDSDSSPKHILGPASVRRMGLLIFDAITSAVSSPSASSDTHGNEAESEADERESIAQSPMSECDVDRESIAQYIEERYKHSAAVASWNRLSNALNRFGLWRRK